ncbi:MAG: cytochrome c oxidase subunit [Actinomycetia bacterium]|nr:cytochrome c oxidase subunit [Actinomycetes bacterium]
MREPRHGLRILLLWLVLSAVAVPLVYVVWGPHLPPGDMSTSAEGQRFDNAVLGAMAAPVVVGVLVYFGYALVVWRVRDGDEETDGPPLRGNVRLQATWMGVTSAVVLGVFVFGTYELIVPNGAGAGEGPAPIWKPGGEPLQIQVIAQQWRFTYRFPQFGGMETPELVLPVGQDVQFDVTSLDVVHGFWANELGVKADANPGVDDVAYTRAKRVGAFTVRCSELCGIWHGAMTTNGRVVSVADFQTWGQSAEVSQAAITKLLPPYALTYSPSAISTLTKLFTDNGLNGAGGQYYGPQYPVQP